MDDIRSSYSGLKKKIKHKLTGAKHKPGGKGVDTGGERGDSPGSLLRSEPRIIAGGGHSGEEDRTKVDGRRVRSTNRPPQSDEPESVPARGSDKDQGGVSQVYSYLRADAVGGGLGREWGDADGKKIEQVHPSPSTPWIPRGGEPDRV